MPIREQDIKKLWALSGGRCAYPGCNANCIPFLDSSDPTVIGEMAHVIANSPVGPRGDGVGGDDTYANLVLLCPTHHKYVDKAPAKFPAETLFKWKANHESNVERATTAPVFPDRQSLFAFILGLLAENKACWQTYGPDSEHARRNPGSSAVTMWQLRKLSVNVANNSVVVGAIKRHRELFTGEELAACSLFIEHAAGFEHNCFEVIEGVPRFPSSFESMLNE